jgi:membrane protein
LAQARFRQHSSYIARHPGTFLMTVVKGFRANQGLLLAGAVAYYTLLSLIPLLILMLVALSHFVDRTLLLSTLSEYLEFIVPGQSAGLLDAIRTFLVYRDAVGGALLITMLLFSALAFTVLESAMSVIFAHRVAAGRRHFIVSALMPYVFILFLGIGFLIVTVVAGQLESLGSKSVEVFGVLHSLGGLSAYLLYAIGVVGEVLILTAIYLVMPVGRLSLRHALIGGASAAMLWEITRHIVVWYYNTLSQVSVVYGSLTTAIAALLSVEIAAIVLLFGAQVIAEYERIGATPKPADRSAFETRLTSARET